jgi:hypothetical protein
MATATSWAGATVTVPEFLWDEPEGCSPRGWLLIKIDTHPDGADERLLYAFSPTGPDQRHLACGWYLDYSDSHVPDPTKPVLWRAYMFRVGPGGGVHELGCDWIGSVQEAKAMIAGNVRAYMGLPRE